MDLWLYAEPGEGKRYVGTYPHLEFTRRLAWENGLAAGAIAPTEEI